MVESQSENLKKAVLWEGDRDKKVRCKLCAHRCVIGDGKLGRCCVRKNIDGVLYSLNYYKVCSANPDPIEKKPLYHFQPGSSSFSIATMGCNFRCEFCQNWQISQAGCSLRMQINRIHLYRADGFYGAVQRLRTAGKRTRPGKCFCQ
ncbi:MAG: hypothetical protein ABSG99_03670 [Sedimentisphaerales bacterium]